MYGFSGEHLLVLLIILLIFGPKRLPDLGHSIGRTLKNFKDGMNGGKSDNPSASQNPQQIASEKPLEKTEAPVTEEKKAEEKV
jgi:sec-independent protein translocase protein TatA